MQWNNKKKLQQPTKWTQECRDTANRNWAHFGADSFSVIKIFCLWLKQTHRWYTFIYDGWRGNCHGKSSNSQTTVNRSYSFESLFGSGGATPWRRSRHTLVFVELKSARHSTFFARSSQSWHLLRELYPWHLHLKLALPLTGGDKHFLEPDWWGETIFIVHVPSQHPFRKPRDSTVDQTKLWKILK